MASLKDRWALVQNHFRKTIPEFEHLKPSRSHTRAQQGAYTYGGLYWRESGLKVHPVKITRPQGADGSWVVVPAPYTGPVRTATPEIAQWLSELRFKEFAVAREAGGLEYVRSLDGRIERGPREPDKTIELCEAFPIGRKQKYDLSIDSPASDDVEVGV